MRCLRALIAGLLLAAILTGARADLYEQTLYTARARDAITVFSAPDRQTPLLGYLRRGDRMEIVDVDPDWLTVRFGETAGFIRRRSVDAADVVPLDPSRVPPYPAVACAWIAHVAEKADVRIEAHPSADPLLTLGAGTRLALIDIEDGWGRLIYHRRYGYVDTRLLSDLHPVAAEAEAAFPGELIAAYTSFYRMSQDESNLNRIENLHTACVRLSSRLLQAGDTLDFNRDIGPYSRANGYLPAIVLVNGGTVLGYGGGTCQVSSTLYNVVLQLPGISILRRRPHGPAGASYLPLGADAAVGTETQNFIFQNRYAFPLSLDGSVCDGALTLAVYRAPDSD